MIQEKLCLLILIIFKKYIFLQVTHGVEDMDVDIHTALPLEHEQSCSSSQGTNSNMISIQIIKTHSLNQPIG